jgi:hypothetical protein
MYINLINADYIGEPPNNKNLTEIQIAGTPFLVKESLKNIISIFKQLKNGGDCTKKGCDTNNKSECI